MPDASSLVVWLNSLCQGNLNNLSELSSGEYLAECLKTVDSECGVHEDDYWTFLLGFLRDNYECSISRSIDEELLREGNEEHIARCSAKESVVSGIRKLDTEVQADMKVFIESGLASVTSHMLEAGLFQSGIGSTEESSRPNEEEFISPPRRQLNFYCRSPTVLTRTPSVSSSGCLTRAIATTPAALHWLSSPTLPQCSSEEALTEELCQLKFKYSVLEKALHQERLLCEELSSEQAQKVSDLQEMDVVHKSAISDLQRAHESTIRDLEDELLHLKQKVISSEAAQSKLQQQLNNIVEEHEKELKTITDQEILQQQNVEKATSLMTEQTTQMQRLEAKLKCAEAELNGKIQIIQSLENSEKDKEDEIRSLLSKIESLNSIIVDKNTEHLMTSECLSSTETKLRERSQEILGLQDKIRAMSDGVLSEKTAQVQHLTEQLQTAEAERSELLANIEIEKTRVQSLHVKQETSESRHRSEVDQLSTQLEAVKQQLTSSEVNKRRLQQEVSDLTQQLKESSEREQTLQQKHYYEVGYLERKLKAVEDERSKILQSKHLAELDSNPTKDVVPEIIRTTHLSNLTTENNVHNVLGGYQALDEEPHHQLSEHKCGRVSQGGHHKISQDSPHHESEDPHQRVSELQRRNAQRMPHLRSSYAVEMQVQPFTIKLSDENIKPKISSPPENVPHSLNKTTQMLENASVFKSNSRKRSSDVHLNPLLASVDVCSCSPPAKRNSNDYISTIAPTIPSATSKGLNLREYLDNKPTLTAKQNTSTAFDIEFSPPRKKGKPPARLTERRPASQTQTLELSPPKKKGKFSPRLPERRAPSQTQAPVQSSANTRPLRNTIARSGKVMKSVNITRPNMSSHRKK